MGDRRCLYILCDVEGASGISQENRRAMFHGSEAWEREGRDLITSDVKAVCEAAAEFGVDDIVLNDSHDYGNRQPNVRVEELPSCVRMVRRPYLPGKPKHMIRGNPWGMVIVGQHARYGGGGFAPHTIQSPPIGRVTLNGLEVGEIGLELALFMGTPLLALVGEEAAVAEARALCPNVVGVAVKSLERSWFPSAEEMRSVIRERLLEAFSKAETASSLELPAPYRFTLEPTEAYRFDVGDGSAARGVMLELFRGLAHGAVEEGRAIWRTKTIIGGLWALHTARGFLRKRA